MDKTQQNLEKWQTQAPGKLLRSPLMASYIIIASCFGGLGIWSVTAHISSAVIASGIVSPEGSRKTVQHMEGGIISEILVENGDTVSEGQPLMILQDNQVRAAYQDQQNRKWLLEATMARLVAEQEGAESFSFPQWMVEEANSQDELQQLMDAQQSLFYNRLESYKGRVAIGERQIAQTEEEINGLQSQITSQRTQMTLIEEELADKKRLLDRGLFSRPEYLALQRQQSALQGDIAVNQASIARARQNIGDTQMQISNIDSDRLDQISADLAEVRTELDSVNQQLSVREDALTRTIITAPESGTVVNRRFHETGTVVRPGDPIIDLVPSDSQLIINARVSPIDIDEVREEMEARVVFTAFGSRTMPQITGKIRTVSAERQEDQSTGQTWYMSEIEVPEIEIAKIGDDTEITSGMPVEVYVLTGERTFFEYIMKPLTDSIRRSFREN